MSALTDDEVRDGHVTHRRLSESYRATTPTSGSYANDRAATLVHHYLSLLGTPGVELALFDELFADEFVLDFATAHITTIGEFGDWLRSYKAATEAAVLTVESMDVVAEGNGTYMTTIDFEWDGLMPDGSRMEMATRHVWTIADDPAEGFARIRSITVEMTRKMAPRV